ncbi:class I SAM-dependent methyltransferase [Methylovulum psychrotolerans]|uniref:Class I SAM-dependent methyltransferase n=1 Tax=Methylovulum psychrotolerans TaxID=1704499 RepID=A0A2S5CMP9_9GAMM|nr:methyltransferase domain-containing protein [Methylovulum psychrotolerans]POZ52099.1 hypothetical protein AADEFJLK_02321 [Methylovulum psychrotolerans]
MKLIKKSYRYFEVIVKSWIAVGMTLILRTHTERWKKVALSGVPSWDARNKKISSFIPSGSSVIDIGCGAQTLKAYLSEGCSYQPCDIFKSTPDVIVCDFNAGQLVSTDRRYSHVICSGVLEYIRDPKRFINNVSSLGDYIIISYNLFLPSQSKRHRMVKNWVNHFTQAELDALFEELGIVSTLLHKSENSECIYILELKKL